MTIHHRTFAGVVATMGGILLLAWSVSASLASTDPWPAGGPATALASITVNSNQDTATAGDGQCTLREAITNANADADHSAGDCPAGNGHDTILFSLSANSTITLAGQQLPEITSRLTIDSSGAPGLTVNGNDESRLFEIGYSDTVTMTHLILAHGLAADASGGAILNDGDLTIANSAFYSNTTTVTGNFAGAIMNLNGDLTVLDCTFVDNSSYNGGAIASSSNLAVISGSTFVNNEAKNGGAIYHSGGSMQVINSTLSGNAAQTEGGAILGASSTGSLQVLNSTLNGNTAGYGGGISMFFNKSLYLTNTIIANSSAGGDCTPTNSLKGNLNNLVGDGSCNPLLTGDPQLGPLADNGGPTMTHALLLTSPAINQGDDDRCPATDQRGLGRVGACDIGAFELQGEVRRIYLPTCIGGTGS